MMFHDVLKWRSQPWHTIPLQKHVVSLSFMINHWNFQERLYLDRIFKICITFKFSDFVIRSLSSAVDPNISLFVFFDVHRVMKPVVVAKLLQEAFGSVVFGCAYTFISFLGFSQFSQLRSILVRIHFHLVPGIFPIFSASWYLGEIYQE